jgi:molecular chaperone GrpE
MMTEKPTSLEEKWTASNAASDSDVESADASVVDLPTAELQSQVASLTDQLLRQQAEMANFRRRIERDRSEQGAEARRQLLRALLPVVDDFERALGAGTENFEAYRDGVELILKSLHDFLDAAEVERIDPHGDPFDPHMHEAVDHSETDTVPAQHVAHVYQPGYSHAGKLLRPAMVAVARPPATPDDGDDD